MTLAFAPERIEHWPLARLQPYARNAKQHGPEQVAKLADDCDLSLVGFSDGELDKLLAFEPDAGGEEEGGAGGSVPAVTIPEPPRNPASRMPDPHPHRSDR